MKKKHGKTTRREFLKQSAGAAGVIMLGGMVSGCASSAPMETGIKKEEMSAPEGRHHFKVFSAGAIAGMNIKNRFVRSAAMIGADVVNYYAAALETSAHNEKDYRKAKTLLDHTKKALEEVKEPISKVV